MSGQSRYRSTWERYYAASHGVVFVIDSSDAVRLAVAANELRLMLQHPDVRQAGNGDSCRLPILVLANKTDLAAAIPIGQVKEISERADGVQESLLTPPPPAPVVLCSSPGEARRNGDRDKASLFDRCFFSVAYYRAVPGE